MKCKSWIVAAVMMASVSAQAASSAGGGLFYAGALGGLSFINNDVGTKLGLGLQVGSHFHELMSAGLYATYNGLGDVRLSQGGNDYTRNSNLWVFALEANYELVAFLEGSYVGAKVGIGRTKSTIETSDAATLTLLKGLGVADTTSTDLAVGPAVGYQLRIRPDLSVGGEANYILVTTTDTTGIFNLLATATFWF